MRLVRWILRLIAVVFNLAVAVFLLGVGFIGLIEGQDVHFDLVPEIEPENMAMTLIGLGVFGLFSIALSRSGSKAARMLMLLWNLLVSRVAGVCVFRALLQVRWHGAPPPRAYPFPDLALRPLGKLGDGEAGLRGSELSGFGWI